MKKRAFLWLPFLSLALFSCGEEREPIYVPYGMLFDASLDEAEHFVDLSYGSLSSALDREENLLLVVQGSSDGCRCYYDFCNAMLPYMRKHNARVYHMTIKDFEEKEELFGLKMQQEANAVAVFSKGKLAASRLFRDSRPKELEEMTAFLEENAAFGPTLYLNRNQLEEMVHGDQGGLTVGFVRETCSDCHYLFAHAFRDFASETKNASYLFDLDPLRSDMEEYQAFKDAYGLSALEGYEYGYGTGFVPTWLYLTPGEDPVIDLVKDAAVWANDTIAQREDGSYYVATSYWDGTREHEFLLGSEIPSAIEGMTVPTEELSIGRNAYWKNEAASRYHDPILKRFWEFYIG